MNFDENYATVIQDEIQVAHWVHAAQDIMLTAVSTYYDKHESYIIVSNNINHGKHTLLKYLDILIQEIKTL